ncbi:activator-dependent family glycosyltransferase [Streptomyces sp. NPDC006235]|uniref:activator-dependent family glycosyltransferase n=1 Tax=Streptomyces sp. NPDC006235 TaxID=3156736 RepID=UPI0033A3F41E
MRVVFATWPATTHLYPIVPLAWALQNAGHEVRVVSYPGLAETTVAAGLTAVSLGRQVDLTPAAPLDEAWLDRLARDLDPGPEQAHLWECFRHRMLPVLSFHYPGRPPAAGQRAMVDDLVDFARTWQPDLILWDPAFLAAPVAARMSGAAHARLLWGLDYFGWIRAACAELSRRPGADPVDDPLTLLTEPMLRRFGIDADDEMFLGQWTLDLMPPGMRLPLTNRTVPVRAIPYQRVGVLPDWLRDPPDRPRACLTLGVTNRERDIASTVPIPEVLDLLADIDLDIVATLDAGQLRAAHRVPDNVRTVDYVPLNQLLPTCSAMVHHGGFGTFAAAAAHRVPQLVTGALSSWDSGISAGTAHFVQRRGAGLALDGDAFTLDALRDGLLALVHDPAYARGADELYRDLLATPGPAEVVPLLEELTTRHRLRPLPAGSPTAPSEDTACAYS